MNEKKGLPKQLYFVLGSSFFMGLFAGAFLYVTVFAPEYKDVLDAPTAMLGLGEDTIEGSMYGGCERADACASFTLSANRAYQYLATPQSEVQTGKISRELSDSIFGPLTDDILTQTSREAVATNCASYADGIDYWYDVTVNKTTYTLDTCTTQLSANRALQNALLQMWEFLENPTTTYPVLIEEGIGGAVIDRFNNPPTE
jgi:hypothetical protein